MVFIGIDADNLSSAAVCTTFRADGHATLDATPDVVGLLLHAGDRMYVEQFCCISHRSRLNLVASNSVLRGDVPYCTLTLEPTIAHGYHFYSVFTMENSYWALLRQYLRTSTHDLPGRCGRNVIPHIVRYLHDCITNHTTDFLANCSAITGRHRHLPDVRKVDGILQLFALLAIVELDEIIGNRCPVHRRNERQNPGPFHDLLPLVEGIVDVLDSALYVSEKTRPVSIAFNDMWTSFLVQQSVALIVASRSAANPVETPPTVAARILETMGRRSNRIKCGIERLLAGRPCYFGASDMLSLTYDQCVSFKWAFAEQVSRFQLRFEPGGNG
ncbi:hypothetical protein VNI00_010559 [Paramarasmius palmivorus]|uniref:Uncharacterized protein n=1 Tax=Paramarasmius palmivorus TaxID=297713 RepID=A0AAW0CIB6_9AGAR